MKVFIDLHDQINEGENCFAFYCTVSCGFERFGDNETWISVHDFIADYDGSDIDRYTTLIPDKYISIAKVNKWADVKLMLHGHEVTPVDGIIYVDGISNFGGDMTLFLEDKLRLHEEVQDFEECAKIKQQLEKLKSI